MLQLIKSIVGTGRYMILPSRAIQFLLLLFVVGVAGSPVMGQYNVVYTDVWLAGVNQPSETDPETGDPVLDLDSNPYVIVCGYGAVEVYGYSNTSLTVTLTSPNGRTASSTSGNVALELLEDGDYYNVALATGYCGGCNCYHPFAGGGSSRRLGASTVVMANTRVRDSRGRCIYQAIVPCDVHCKGFGRAHDTDCNSNYGIWVEPWLDIGVALALPTLGRAGST